MGILDHYPEGTDMSYFDWDDEEQDITCPNCGVVSPQTVFVQTERRTRHCSLTGECPECGHEFEEEWLDE